MINRILLILTIGLFFTSLAEAEELRNRIQLSVTPKAVLTSPGAFQYTYTLVSGPSSAQRVSGFTVECRTPVTFVDRPSGWFGSYNSLDKLNAFASPIVTWGPFSEANCVSPGGSATGLSLKSVGLPGIVAAYGEGFVPIPKLVDGEYTKALPYKDTLYKTYTIGPVGQPTMTLAETVDYMVVQKHQAAAQGWITKHGIVVSLDQKLDQAKAKILQGNNKAAANVMNAFVNELQAQKGKAVNEEAYTLLYVNAQWLISRLSPTN